MFLPSKMKKVRLQLAITQEDRFLREVSKLGILQIKNLEEKVPNFSTENLRLVEERNFLENLIRRCDALLNRMPKESIIEQLFSKKSNEIKIKENERDELLKNAENILKESEEKIQLWEAMKKQNLASKAQLSQKISSALRGNFLVLIGIRKTEYLTVIDGWMKEKDVVKLRSIIENTVGKNAIVAVEKSTIGKNKNIVRIRIAVLATDYPKLESELNTQGIAKIELEKEKAEKIEFIEEAIDIISIRNKLSLLRRILLDQLEIIKAKEKIATSKFLALIEGWIKEKDVEKLVSLLKNGNYDYQLSIEDPTPTEKDTVPVSLENPPLIRSFEILTTMFGYPKYGQIDPTPFLFIFFTIFFGIMFADVFDGLLLLIFAFLLLRGYGSKSEGGRKLSEILIAISLSSMFFGFLSGEFMGGVIKIPTLWFNGFEDPMYFFYIAIVLGLIQLTLGFIIGFINELLNKNIKRAIGEKLSWLIMIYGSLIFIVGSYLSKSILSYAGIILAISGLLILLASNLMNLMEITRIISNVVSYARLVAINMSHVGIARAFALLAGPLISSEGGILGLLVGGFILIVAHAFIVFIEGFVAFAHSLRLHFVEFFSKFFEPSNNVFIPLKVNI